MYNNSIFRKTSIFAIVAITIVAGMMVGCQKEWEDEVMFDEGTKILDSYKPIRLKGSGTECNGTIHMKSVILKNSKKNVTGLQGGTVYEVCFREAPTASGGGGTSWLILRTTKNNPLELVHTGPGNPPSYAYVKTGQDGGYFELEHNQGAAAEVTVYRCPSN